MSIKSGEAPSATRLKREVWWFIAAAAGLLAGAAGLLQPPRADPFQVVTPWTRVTRIHAPPGDADRVNSQR